jgi:hypothetical protein
MGPYYKEAGHQQPGQQTAGPQGAKIRSDPFLIRPIGRAYGLFKKLSLEEPIKPECAAGDKPSTPKISATFTTSFISEKIPHTFNHPDSNE